MTTKVKEEYEFLKKEKIHESCIDIGLHVSKVTDSMIQEFAIANNIEYDEAGELLIRIGNENPDLW